MSKLLFQDILHNIDKNNYIEHLTSILHSEYTVDKYSMLYDNLLDIPIINSSLICFFDYQEMDLFYLEELLDVDKLSFQDILALNIVNVHQKDYYILIDYILFSTTHYHQFFTEDIRKKYVSNKYILDDLKPDKNFLHSVFDNYLNLLHPLSLIIINILALLVFLVSNGFSLITFIMVVLFQITILSIGFLFYYIIENYFKPSYFTKYKNNVQRFIQNNPYYADIFHHYSI